LDGKEAAVRCWWFMCVEALDTGGSCELDEAI